MSADYKNFLGLDGMVWWFGVVENRQDPLGLGRVQVRVFGWHSASLQEIPSANLPWAHCLFALNDRAFGTPRENDFVIGFWADGRNAQHPVVMGLVPSKVIQAANLGAGFGDLRSSATLKLSPKLVVSRNYNSNGAGIILTEANTASNSALEAIRHPTPDELGQDSITGLSRYQNLANTVIQARKSNLDTHVKSAGNTQWSEPYPAYNPLYPFNQVTETESGHVFELDDTPGSERIHLAHRSGSFIEFYPTGTRVEKVTKSNYSIVMGDDYVHIMGRVFISVGGDAHISVTGDTMIEVGNDMSANVAGDMDFSIGGNFNIKAKNINLDIDDDFTVVSDSQHLTSSSSLDVSTGDMKLTGSGGIDINAGDDLNQQSGGSVNIIGSDTVAIEAATIGLGGEVLAESVSTGSIPAGPADSAEQGTVTGLPAAIGVGTKNTGIGMPEKVPVPLPGPFQPELDGHTGAAASQSQFLVNNGSGGTTTPDANAASNTANCSFNASQHTFISDPTTWQISASGLNLIKSFEGYAKLVAGGDVTAYPDPATGGQPYTIGYGTTSAAIGQPISLGMLISMATAESFLETSIANEYLTALNQSVTVPLTQNMIDSCLSFIYNIGVGNWSQSSVLSLINQQQWCQAANAFLLWNKANGQVLSALTNRRSKERGLFLS